MELNKTIRKQHKKIKFRLICSLSQRGLLRYHVSKKREEKATNKKDFDVCWIISHILYVM